MRSSKKIKEGLSHRKKFNVFNLVYLCYNWLRRLTKDKNVYLLVLVISFTIIAIVFFDLFKWWSIAGACGALALVGAREALKRIIITWITNTGGSFQLQGTHLIVGEDYETGCKLWLNGIDREYFEFAGVDSMGTVADINHRAYNRGPWSTYPKEKFDRNKSHVLKNEYAIMLIKDEGKVVGYTHIFPISFETWFKYTNPPGIHDNVFSDDYVGENEKDRNFAIMIFSLAMDPDFEVKLNDKHLAGLMVEKAMALQISEHLKSSFPHKHSVTAIFQNMGSMLLNFFDDASVILEHPSADEAQLVKFEIKNPHYTPEPRKT